MEPAERMQALLRYTNRTHVAAALSEAGYPVSYATVNRWAAGKNVTPRAVAIVESLLGTAKEPQPDWAEALRKDVTTTRSLVEELVVRQAAGLVTLGEVRELVERSADGRDDSRERPGQDERPVR